MKTSNRPPAADTRRNAAYLLASFLILILGSPHAYGDQKRLSAELREPAGAEQIEVIVQYRTRPTEAHHRRVRSLGGRLHSSMEFVHSAHYSVPASALEELSDDPDVLYISPNRPVQQMMDIPAETVNAAAAASAGLDGSGVGVAVIDSGIGLGSNFNHIVYQASFVGGAAVDQWGHGTHVTGLIASNGAGSVYTGIVPNANIVNLRALDQTGSGTDATVINAINAAISLKSKYNIRVINLSLGRAVYEPAAQDPLCQAVEKAWQAGIVVVVAAGNQGRNNTAANNGYGTIAAPGNDPYVITVGAMKDMHTSTRSDDLIASYSSKGPTLFDHFVKPDIVAPGNLVVSTMGPSFALAAAYPENKVGGTEYILSGTSMATPIVSGAAVALIQKNPSLTPDQVKARLMKTASKTFPVSSVAVDPVSQATYTSYYDIFTIGSGYLDIAAALGSTDTATGRAISPTAVYNVMTGQVTVQNTPTGSTAVWGSTSVWGSTAVWGSSVWASGSTAVWGSSAVPGSTAILGSTAVWGNTAVWGDTAVWGNTAVWGDTTTDTSEAVSVAINGEN